jgi:predicted nucleotidyltransferase
MTALALARLLPNEQAAITAYIDHIRARFSDRILAVMLFGSKARGDADAESDLDLLVLVDVETPEFRSKLWQVASDISLDYSVVLSPRVVGQARWDDMHRMRLPLYRAIITDGIALTPEPLPT